MISRKATFALLKAFISNTEVQPVRWRVVRSRSNANVLRLQFWFADYYDDVAEGNEAESSWGVVVDDAGVMLSFADELEVVPPVLDANPTGVIEFRRDLRNDVPT